MSAEGNVRGMPESDAWDDLLRCQDVTAIACLNSFIARGIRLRDVRDKNNNTLLHQAASQQAHKKLPIASHPSVEIFGQLDGVFLEPSQFNPVHLSLSPYLSPYLCSAWTKWSCSIHNQFFAVHRLVCSLFLHDDEVYIQIVCSFCVALCAGCSGWDERIGGEPRRPYLRWLLKVYSLCGAIRIGGMVWAGELMFDCNRSNALWLSLLSHSGSELECFMTVAVQCKMVLNSMLLVWQAEQQGKFVVTYFWLHECLQAGRVITFYFLLSWQFQLIQVVSHDDNPGVNLDSSEAFQRCMARY